MQLPSGKIMVRRTEKEGVLNKPTSMNCWNILESAEEAVIISSRKLSQLSLQFTVYKASSLQSEFFRNLFYKEQSWNG